MATKLTYHSTFNEVGWSLRETLDAIEVQGETPHLKYDMLLKYGRVSLMEGKLDKAYKVFQQCSIHAIDNGQSPGSCPSPCFVSSRTLFIHKTNSLFRAATNQGEESCGHEPRLGKFYFYTAL